MLDAFRDFSGLITTILIILGWAVIYSNAKKIATRSETKSLLDRALEQAELCSNFATDFWLPGSSVQPDPDHFQLVFMTQISRLNVTIKALEHRCIKVDSGLLAKFITHSTLNAEQMSEFGKTKRNEKGLQINHACMRLTESLIAEFDRRYKPIDRWIKPRACGA
ncbi:hypothetical protein [Salinivibrio sp. KP-1]|uniref:hypothetical protein n=1 Tax=Salinivibrio sp. KP-1 TaxID=1406902 RepID=UPI000614786B|nr:hypothetical protein [Salinivibrio sp. KP-1]KKA43416.1 hypothetical protein WN56_13570 [Salinivibrio sp. KP-1]